MSSRSYLPAIAIFSAVMFEPVPFSFCHASKIGIIYVQGMMQTRLSSSMFGLRNLPQLNFSVTRGVPLSGSFSQPALYFCHWTKFDVLWVDTALFHNLLSIWKLANPPTTWKCWPTKLKSAYSKPKPPNNNFSKPASELKLSRLLWRMLMHMKGSTMGGSSKRAAHHQASCHLAATHTHTHMRSDKPAELYLLSVFTVSSLLTVISCNGPFAVSWPPAQTDQMSNMRPVKPALSVLNRTRMPTIHLQLIPLLSPFW